MEIFNKETSTVIKGKTIRTNNSSVGEIGSFWAEMAEEFFPYMLVNATVYGVYSNYESDNTADFDLLVGADRFSESLEGLQTVEIPTGKYLRFSKEGHSMADNCIALWQEIWTYFNSDEKAHERAYLVDFEKYSKDGNLVEIYISIK